MAFWFKLSSAIKWVGKKISGVSSDEWDTVVNAVVEAEEDLTDSSTKRDFVKGVAAGVGPILAGWILNLLVELALAYAKERGYVDA